MAVELAGATYDMLMVDNLLYKTWRDQNPDLVRGPSWDGKKLRERFVAKNWGKHIAAARATLVGLLQQPIDESLKEEIMEILALDSTLIRGRANPAILAGEVSTKN